MEISSGNESFLAALKGASEGRAKLKLDVIQSEFLRAFPHLQGNADRRDRLRSLLDALAISGSIRLPANERHGWERAPAPALPKWILFVRGLSQNRQLFDHRSFPWVPELAFVAALRSLRDPHELQQIHTFLKNGGRHRPIVPVKERSYQLFGDEKRLESLQNSQLFTKNRLTLEMMRCRQVPASLPCVPVAGDAQGPWLILENESTFHSFYRLNQLVNLHAGIILGSGFAVHRATEFLASLLQTIPGTCTKQFLYFGDLDLDGIQIPFQLDQKLQNRFGIQVRPAETYYQWLIDANGIKCLPSRAEYNAPFTWFPLPMRQCIEVALGQTRPVVQEAIGWEFLAAKFGVPNDSPF
jgi:hypothetical protein